jgi:hypothetical protein
MKRSRKPKITKSQLKGKGFKNAITSRVKAVFKGISKEMPKQVQAIVESQQGNVPIIRVELGRNKVQGYVQKFLNGISLGQYERTKQNLKYDDVYHNYLILYLSNGAKYKLEKNERVSLKPTSERGQFTMFNSNQPTLQLLFHQAQVRYHSSLWVYHPQSNNCQHFVKQICTANRILPDSDACIQAYNGQDAGQLLKNIKGPLSLVPKALTDVAAYGDHIIHGGKVSY